MTLTDTLILLTLKELELIVKNLQSSNIISNPLERYIVYAAIAAELKSYILNVKYIQAQSHQSFYKCNQAVKNLKARGWVHEKINENDKRIIDILPTNKSRTLTSVYEQAKFDSYKDLHDGTEVKLPLNFEDMLDANENKLDEISKALLLKKKQ